MKRKVSPFDVLGVLSVLALLAVAAGDLRALRAMGDETALAISVEDLEAGFREGVSWYGLYLDDEKIGFSRIEQRREGDGMRAKNRLVVKPTVFSSSLEIGVDLDLELDTSLRPRRFVLGLDMGTATIEADGEVENGTLTFELRSAGLKQQARLDIGDSTVDLGLKPAFVRSRPEVGARREFDYFDPVAMQKRTTIVEYLGQEAIEILGEEVLSHHLRQYLGEQVLDAWVNDIGEVLREEMPMGIVAVRETEAAATYGFGRGAPALQAEDVDPQHLLDFVEGLQKTIPGAAKPPPEGGP